MQERPNYSYNDYNSLKDPNQQGQNSNKQGKKSLYNKNYYKGGSNKNNNLEEINMNNNEHTQNYRNKNIGYRATQQHYKKKKGGKKRENNDYPYQGNNAVEINPQMKDDYNEQNNMNIGGNNHPNLYGKNYKKNQNNIYNNNNINMNNNVINNSMNNMNMNTSLGSMNSNTNSTGTSNISNLNLTPQSKNQITSPLSYNSNNSPINPKYSQNPKNIMKQNNIYVNPNLLESFRNKKDNDQDMSLKDDKSSETLSEDNMNFQQANKMGPNILGNLGNNMNQIDLNKAQNEFMNQQDYMNQMNPKFIPQQNNFYIHYNNMNGINNIGNAIDNMGNLNNLNQMNNMNNISPGNYPQMPNLQTFSQSPIPNMVQSVPNMNNMNAINNLSLNNFQRSFYDNSNNKVYNPNSLPNNFNYATSQEDINMNKHKNDKKRIPNNKSPLEASNLMNRAMTLSPGMGNNLNYNGANNFVKNQNNSIPIKMNNNRSSKGTQNKIPNGYQNDNNTFNILGNQNQNLPQMLNMNLAQMNNRNYYIQPTIQNMRNSQMNQGYINNNHINIGNNIISKDYQNTNFNPNLVNNKQKYQKFNNQNTYQVQKHNNMNNNNQIFQKNKNNDINNNLINNNLNNKNFGLKSGNENNLQGSNKSNFSIGGNNQMKQYILSVNIKLGNKNTKTIKIKSLNECSSILDELKEGNYFNEKEKKLIQEKINKTYELFFTGKIYEFGIKNNTYKNLSEIYHKLNYENNNQERKMMNNKLRFIKKNKSFKEFNEILNDERKLTIDNVRNVGSLNITF